MRRQVASSKVSNCGSEVVVLLGERERPGHQTLFVVPTQSA
jgi:hypothetical protein